MNNGMTNRVTSLSFSQYDPKDYILDHESGMKLSSINKILLNLFNNDLYAYTILVGKMKGLWWKYWFADATRPGYSSGDMVYVNGVQEMQFLRKYWKGIQQIANYNVISNKLPDFRSNDDDIVTKYMNALTDYFHLGNRGLAGQIYISLKDNNKDPVPVTTSWQPYLVTDEELQRREYHLNDLLENAVRNHNFNYHACLDKLDEADSAYEVNNVHPSIYNDVLETYLPKVGIVDEEHQAWVNFAASPTSNKLLGFGTEAFDFLHIFKPLGTDTHCIETWIRSDGHVSIRGYIPIVMLTELVPEIGTIEYNQWKMGGTRRFGMRLDYAINNSMSKVYFSHGETESIESIVNETEQSFGLMKQRAYERMLDEQEQDDPIDSIYKILSYRKDSGAVVLFHPKNCDFQFSDILFHPDSMRPDDVKIFEDLFGEDKYSHITEPMQQDEEVESHLFSKKFVQPVIPKEDISPVDTTTESNPSIVSSDIRLLRNFGIVRSPAIEQVFFKKVFPDSAEILSPAFVKTPSMYVGEWTWLKGQSIIFEVPTNTQNISFEIDGMIKKDNIDFSMYDICKDDEGNLQWIYDVVIDYEFPKAIIMPACEKGFEDEKEFPMLIKNMDGMMSKIKNCVIDYPTFISFMQFRTLDIVPLNSLLHQLRSRADGYLRDDDPLGTEEFIKHARMLKMLYDYIYKYIEENMRFKALHDFYSELMSSAVAADLDKVVMIHRLQGYLKKNQMRRGSQSSQPDIDDAANEWIAEVDDVIKEIENEISPLVKDGNETMANQFASAVKRLKTLHENYVNERELEFKSLVDLPNLDPESQEYLDELKKYQDKYLDNFREIDVYLGEVENTLNSATEIREKINAYLNVDWLDEKNRIYLNYQLSKLNDSMERYKIANMRICDGYDKYMKRWMSIMGIDGSIELKDGFTVNDLISGDDPLRSLITMKSKLEAFV